MKMIKFRAKSMKDQTWVYGWYIETFNTEKEIKSSIVTQYAHNYYELQNNLYIIDVDENTLGQFAGFYDHSRNEIYEGDIVSVHLCCPREDENGETIEDADYIICIGEYENNKSSCYGVYGILLEKYRKFMYSYEYQGSLHSFSEEFYKIGNVFDDPELISEKDRKRYESKR